MAGWPGIKLRQRVDERGGMVVGEVQPGPTRISSFAVVASLVDVIHPSDGIAHTATERKCAYDVLCRVVSEEMEVVVEVVVVGREVQLPPSVPRPRAVSFAPHTQHQHWNQTACATDNSRD